MRSDTNNTVFLSPSIFSNLNMFCLLTAVLPTNLYQRWRLLLGDYNILVQGEL